MDNAPIDPDAYRKIISAEKSLEVDERVTLTFECDVLVTVYFRITWNNIHEQYTTEHVNKNGEHLVVDEMTRALVLSFFEEHFKISKVFGMCTEEEHEDQAERLAFLMPQSV
tara:strand:- start:152 stop:487 length:336 start_codon:yes stop_codon:yes gene_type:complete